MIIEGIKVRQVGRIEIKQGLTGHAAGIRFNLGGQVIGKPMKNFDLESEHVLFVQDRKMTMVVV